MVDFSISNEVVALETVSLSLLRHILHFIMLSYVICHGELWRKGVLCMSLKDKILY